MIIAKQLIVGDTRSEETTLGPVNSERQRTRVTGFLDRRPAHAEVVTGGDALERSGFYLEPTVVANLEQQDEMIQREIFGPVISAIPFTDIEEVIQRGNATTFGLGSGVWTRDVSKAHKMARSIRAGSVWVNCYQAMDPAVPFGGYKMSGYGRESGLIDGLSLVIHPGERIGLIGRSGAGKSTLVNLMLRFFDLEDGAILIDGQDIAKTTQESLRTQISVVTQDTSLLHRTIRDNIRYGQPDATDDEIVEAANRPS